MTAVLEIEKLSKTYKQFTALDSVSLTIERGEIFALLGPNGAGKTTLIGCVCGLIKKSQGLIRVLGADIDADPVKARYNIGLVPQEINFDPFFTVRESLEIQSGYFGVPAQKDHIDSLLKALTLEDKANQTTRSLSGGMKRRLLIAKALVHKPKLVFLDEPTAGVDVELRRDLWAYVQKLREAGTTVVLTTHYLEEAEALADRVGIISKGKLTIVEEKKSLMKRLGERKLQVTFKNAVTLPEALQKEGTLTADGMTFTAIERAGSQPLADTLGRLYAAQLPVSDVSMSAAKLEDVLLRVLSGEAT